MTSTGSDLMTFSGDCGPGGNSLPTEKSASGELVPASVAPEGNGAVFVVNVTVDEEEGELATERGFPGGRSDDETPRGISGPQTRLLRDLMKSAGDLAPFPLPGNRKLALRGWVGSELGGRAEARDVALSFVLS